MSLFLVRFSLFYRFISSETIDCNADWSDSPCQKQSIFCKDNSTDCSFNCRGEGSCEETIFYCQPNRQCTVNCIGVKSCRGPIPNAVVNCPQNAQCRINCDGLSSCESMEINCLQSTNCTISANGQYALSDSFTSCPSHGHCSAHCGNLHSCDLAHFDARNSAHLSVDCANNVNACKNIQIKCPQNTNGTKKCQLFGDEGTTQNQMKMYAINSWDDIDLSLYLAKSAISDTFQLRMYCEADYDEQCIISSKAWNCQNNESKCFRNGIANFPTYAPTKSPTDESMIKYRYGAIIGIICGIILFFVALFFGYFYCLKQQKEYDSVHQINDDPDADLMDDGSADHMFKKGDVPNNKARASMDVELKDGFHIVNEYSDITGSKIGRGLLPISEEKSLKSNEQKEIG